MPILECCIRKLEEAERRAGQLRSDSASAVLSARRAAALLRGKEQEVGLPELQGAAHARLASWLSWVDSRKSLEMGAEVGGSQVSTLQTSNDWSHCEC